MEQKTTRRGMEEASHVKRQRVATEKLHYLAAAENIPICVGAVAEPRRLSMDMGHGMRKGFFVYVIPSTDRTSLLVYDLITGEVHVYPYDADKQLSSLPVIDRMQWAGPDSNHVFFDGYYRPIRWYVLEPYLVSGDLFDAQRKRTKLLQKFATEAGIEYSDDHRAKLAEVDGQTCWSLYIQDNKYVICYLDGETFDVVDKASVWVLQQRVADRKIRDYAKKWHLKAAPSRPLMAVYKGGASWVLFYEKDGKEGFIICPIRPDFPLTHVSYRDKDLVFWGDFSKYQEKSAAFDYEIGGLYFRGVSWLEFEPMDVVIVKQ